MDMSRTETLPNGSSRQLPPSTTISPTHASRIGADAASIVARNLRIGVEPATAGTAHFTVTIGGLALSAPAGAAGAIEVRTGLTASSPWWVENPILEPVETPLWTGPVSAEPVGETGRWHAVRWRIPFVVHTTLDEAAVGRLAATIRLVAPGTLRLSDGSPEATVVLDDTPSRR